MRGAAAIVALSLLVSARPVHADVDLWPLLEVSEDSTTVLYPLYVHEDDFLMMFPLYYRTNEGRDHHLLWPLLKVSDGRLERLTPLWYSDKVGSFTLLPLLKQTPRYTAMLVPPLYLRSDDSLQALIPLYVRARDDAGGDDLWIAWRLFGWRRHGNASSLTVGYLFERWTGDDGYGSYLFPLYYWGRKQERSRFGLLFPIFHKAEWETGSSFWLFPYAQTRSVENDSTSLFPLFSSSRRSTAAGRISTTRELSVLWPLFAREETTGPDGELIRRYRRFLVFSDERDEDGRRLSVLGFVVREDVE